MLTGDQLQPIAILADRGTVLSECAFQQPKVGALKQPKLGALQHLKVAALQHQKLPHVVMELFKDC